MGGQSDLCPPISSLSFVLASFVPAAFRHGFLLPYCYPLLSILLFFLPPLLVLLSFPMPFFDLIFFSLFLVLCDLDGLFGGVEAVGGSGGGDPAVDAVGVAGYAGDFSSGV